MNAVFDPIRNIQNLFDWFLANREGLLIGGLVAAAIVALMLVLRLVGERIVERHPDCRDWIGIIGSVLAKTGILFMIAAALEIVTSYASPAEQVSHLVHVVFVIVAAIQIAVWARELVMGAVRSRVGEEPGESTLGNAISIIRVLVSFAAFAIAVIAILDNLGVNVTTLVAGLGIGGIAIGLAAQGIFSDLFAALSIVFDRPFRRGDTVRYGTTTGTVEQIGLKTTRIRAQGGEQVVMSNKNLLDQEIHNLATARARRTWLPFGVVYQTEPEVLERMPEIIEAAIKPIKSCRMVRCCITGFGDSAIDFDLVYDDRSIEFDALAKHRSAICLGIIKVFAEQGIDFAYPTQTTFTSAPDGTMIMPYADVQRVVSIEKRTAKGPAKGAAKVRAKS
ncbi:MAG: mechanosensitive ion channel domain-containing protein [Sphingomicrobium sp.]